MQNFKSSQSRPSLFLSSVVLKQSEWHTPNTHYKSAKLFVPASWTPKGKWRQSRHRDTHKRRNEKTNEMSLFQQNGKKFEPWGGKAQVVARIIIIKKPPRLGSCSVWKEIKQLYFLYLAIRDSLCRQKSNGRSVYRHDNRQLTVYNWGLIC